MDSDYLTYLAFAKKIINNEIIYQDFFSHKGPYFLLYLAVFSKIIGFGQIQSWIILSITVVFFYLSVLLLCNKFRSDKIFVLTIIFIIFSFKKFVYKFNFRFIFINFNNFKFFCLFIITLKQIN